MRTTVTLEPDVAARIHALMRERGLTFKEAINHAIRQGLGPPADRRPFRTPTFDMGPAAVPLGKALQLAAALEDEETLRKLALRK